jgi:hypothetical protein
MTGRDRRGRIRSLLAYTIAALSIVVAFVGYRSSVIADDASEVEAQAIREESRAAALQSQLEARIAHDKGLVNQIALLQAEAEALSAASRRAELRGSLDDARRLGVRALQKRRAAEHVLRGIVVAFPTGSSGELRYNEAAARAGAPETAELSTVDVARLGARGDELQRTSVRLLGAATLLVLAVGVLTAARLASGRRSELLGVIGALCAVIGLAAVVWIGP